MPLSAVDGKSLLEAGRPSQGRLAFPAIATPYYNLSSPGRAASLNHGNVPRQATTTTTMGEAASDQDPPHGRSFTAPLLPQVNPASGREYPAGAEPRSRSQRPQQEATSPDRQRRRRHRHERDGRDAKDDRYDRLPRNRSPDGNADEAPRARRKAKSVPRQYERDNPYSERYSGDPQREKDRKLEQSSRARRTRSPGDNTRRKDGPGIREDPYARRARSVDSRRDDRGDTRRRRGGSRDRAKDRGGDRERDRDRGRDRDREYDRDRDRKPTRSEPRYRHDEPRSSKPATRGLTARRPGPERNPRAWTFPGSLSQLLPSKRAAAAFKARRDPGPWVGAKGTRVATAAIGAALADGMSGKKGKKR
ncbi:unnamed protein product [Parascedosporium putredinis]|uniref:Uncharacterized protein n=1 Tax=Parascedosporium putredinis TaxID=1442378 RepID=A0A9P1HEB0_9PEZI|nr:unnamed protein product [Parascedosporium putredinis]CAI8004840.1 unnamed protein product [Parascedosporium putredinis]